ncbi:MAG TPA: glycosyltransferase [Herpetosiphonaceae bacterium]
MKILYLAPAPPYPPHGGGQQRIYQFIQHTARDHEVWLLSLSPSAEATAAMEPLRDLCQVVTVSAPVRSGVDRLRTTLLSPLPDMALRGRSASYAAALAGLLKRVPFDVVQAESIEMVQYGRQRPRCRPLYVYDAFNAEFVLQRRAFTTDLRSPRKLPAAGYSLIQWQKLRWYESRVGRRFGGMMAVSSDDAATLGALTATLPIGVVPNGVDTAFFRRDPQPEPQAESPYTLFTGTLDFRPNIDAVTWFARQVLPLIRAQQPDLRFVVVGRNPTTAVRQLARLPGVEIVGEVADVRPWFERTAAYVVPMRIGGGVRLKLLEALSMEQPVVATHMGAEGVEGLQSGVHALLADRPAEFAAEVCRVVRDRELARRLGAAGRALVVERYDWLAIVPRMVSIWREWLERLEAQD